MSENLTLIRLHAQDTSDHAVAAHWDKSTSNKLHREWMHESFQKLAGQLGYDVVKRGQPEKEPHNEQIA